MPGVFEAVDFRGNYSYDGGVVHYVDPESAIQRCLPLVDDDEKRIIMDVVLLDGEGIELLDKNEKPKSDGLAEMIDAMEKHPKVKYRYLMAPAEQQVKDHNLWNFDGCHAKSLLEAGQRDARNALQLGPGTRFKKLRDLCKKCDSEGSFFSW